MRRSVSESRRYEHALETAKQAAKAAGEVALKHFHEGVTVQQKPDTSPVTEADLAAEATILEILKERDPAASVLAEESGIHDRSSERRWIVDPIDGTRGFARGGEFWGPLVALEEEGVIVAAAFGLPVRNELYWASIGGGAYKNEHKLQVSSISNWSEATLSLGETTRLVRPPHGPGVIQLASTAASTRGLGDLAGVTLVLNGLAEAWLECGVKPWDLAPSRLLVEEAGGRWTTFTGQDNLIEGTAVGSNGWVHDQILQHLKG